MKNANRDGDQKPETDSTREAKLPIVLFISFYLNFSSFLHHFLQETWNELKVPMI